jgi:hypothetical protein
MLTIRDMKRRRMTKWVSPNLVLGYDIIELSALFQWAAFTEVAP